MWFNLIFEILNMTYYKKQEKHTMQLSYRTKESLILINKKEHTFAG